MPITQLVRILDADPELAEGLDAQRAALARRHLVAEVVTVPPGRGLDDALGGVEVDTALGLLILDGVVIRRVRVAGQSAVELLGAGDIVRPWQLGADVASLPAGAEWKVCEPAQIAVLDEDLQTTVARFPSVMRQLTARLVQRANTLALHLALAQLPRVEERLLVLFWHLADRFGRVEPTGVLVPLKLSHNTLAELVYARRPSVTTALTRLQQRGLLLREPGRGWRLVGDPPVERTTPRFLAVS